MTKVMPWMLHRPEREKVVHLVLLVWGVCLCSCAKNDSFQTVNVAKLATLTHGAELVFLEDVFQERSKTYRLEDFFWTGSGDGADENDDGNQWDSDKTTVYKTIDRTKTVLSTVYVGTPSTRINQTDITKCTVNCEPSLTPQGDIKPTPTYDPDYDNSTDDDDDALDADRQFWLLTVLKSDGKDPVLLDLKNSLAKLYKTAFQRQQERHLGIEYRIKREAAAPTDKPVRVYIHNVAKSPVNGDEKIEVLYHVSVSGQPVPANTAAEDMRLVSDREVTEELGYPFLIKAEPYLKPAAPLSLSSSKNTWLFIGTSLVVLFLLLLAVAFLTLCFTKRKKPNLALGMGNRRQIFEQRTGGQEGMTYVSGGDREIRRVQSGAKARQDQSPTYINFRTQTSNETLRSGVVDNRPPSASSTTTISTSSLDISPLMGLHRQKKSRARGAINKTVPLDVRRYPMGLADSDTSSEDTRRTSPDSQIYDNEVVSPKSYLSMLSVKAFPRGNIPEPLNKVLEPVSVLHLDMADDVGLEETLGDFSRRQHFSRHGSMTATEDPGVIGPVVWNMHCQRLQTGVSTDEGTDDLDLSGNVTKMRKRFHDLLDDTFSLFSSRKESPIDEARTLHSEIKSHSAVNRSSDDMQPTIRPRPKTSDPRRSVGTPGSEPPRGAWGSQAPSPLVRPLSASILYRPPVRPKVDVAHVLAEGTLPPNDPAIPLIAAIKSEIGKCSLPGSTTNLIDD